MKNMRGNVSKAHWLRSSSCETKVLGSIPSASPMICLLIITQEPSGYAMSRLERYPEAGDSISFNSIPFPGCKSSCSAYGRAKHWLKNECSKSQIADHNDTVIDD